MTSLRRTPQENQTFLSLFKQLVQLLKRFLIKITKSKRMKSYQNPHTADPFVKIKKMKRKLLSYKENEILRFYVMI